MIEVPHPRAKRAALLLAVLGALLAGAAPAPAQFYDPDDDPYAGDDRGTGETHTFVDEFGRRITMDADGRIVSIEQPRQVRRRFEEPRRFEERRRFEESGRAGERRRAAVEPGDDDYDDGAVVGPDDGSFGNYGYREPYREPRERGDTFSDPGESLPGEGIPGTQEPAIRPNETTAPETRPAPRLVGPKGANAKAQIAAFQILLDRAGISPGVIDGRMGANVDKAVAAYEEKTGARLDPANAQALAEELDATGGPAIVSYTISPQDAAGPYIAAIPDDYGEKAKLPAMSYSRVSEMLAERYHMDEAYLIEINPGADFTRAGTILKVAATGETMTGEVAKIIADKGREQVRAYDAAGRLLVAYPSTIGSSDTPSPSGTVQIARIAFDPGYTYNPKINFTQGQNRSILQIPPGPNGPVGSIWIALSKPTYGIHGTPEPSKIGKTNSHGCVRLTNFDAAELARMVKPGVTVEFLE